MLIDAILVFLIIGFKHTISVNLLKEPKIENLFISICLNKGKKCFNRGEDIIKGGKNKFKINKKH